MSSQVLSALLLVVSTASAAFSQTTSDDRKLLDEAAAIDRQLEQRGLVYHNSELEQYLNGLAAPMLPPSSPDYVHWRFRILREPVANAFALSNGSIYVNTGMLSIVENDDQLAGVLAHEITHVAKSHTFQFARTYRKRVIAGEIIEAALFWTPLSGAAAWSAVIIANVSEVTMVVTLLGYSRGMEREADETAVTLLPMAHRDPAQLARTFELLDARLDPEPVASFWRTHPRTKERIQYIQAMVEGRKIENPTTDPAYLARMRPVILQNLRLDLEVRLFRTAVANAQRLVDTEPNNPESLYWLGEAYRALGPRSVQAPEAERTDSGQNEAHRKVVKRTEEEENRALAATAEGKAALQSNWAKAAEYFLKAGDFAKAHLGLGALYEQENRNAEAAAEYRKYLELAPHSDDRVRAERRLEALSVK